MKRSTLLISTACVALFSGAAHADISAEEVWSDWKANWTQFGYEMQSTESKLSNGLSIDAFSLQIPIDAKGQMIDLSMGQMKLIDTGDGSVTLEMPESYPILAKFTAPDGTKITATIGYRSEDLTMRASGAPGDITYVYGANAMNVSLDKVQVDSMILGDDIAEASMVFGSIEGRTHVSGTDLRKIKQEASIASVTYDFKFKDPEGETEIAVKGATSDLKSQGDTLMPTMVGEMTDLPKMLAQGMAMKGMLSYGTSRMAFALADEGQNTAIETASAEGQFNIEMSQDEVVYDIAAKSVDYDINVPDLPFPVALNFGALGFDVAVPLQPSETPQNAAFGLTLADAETTEMLWSMIDPGKVMPRDPVTVKLDAEGQVTPRVNLLDEQAMMDVQMGDDVPFDLNAITVKNLLVQGVGAMVSGTGAATFDNSKPSPFGDMPAPVGEMNFNIKGANGLIDRLVEMGVVPADQAMMPRMMLGLFARPADGEDALTSKIEFKEGGEIWANGQRVQ